MGLNNFGKISDTFGSRKYEKGLRLFVIGIMIG